MKFCAKNRNESITAPNQNFFKGKNYRLAENR